MFIWGQTMKSIGLHRRWQA